MQRLQFLACKYRQTNASVELAVALLLQIVAHVCDSYGLLSRKYKEAVDWLLDPHCLLSKKEATTCAWGDCGYLLTLNKK